MGTRTEVQHTESFGCSEVLKVLSVIIKLHMMSSQEKTLLRVILTEGDIRKVSLAKKPDSVDNLVVALKESLGLNYNFSLQYEDQDFGNALCNLTDISELQDRATLKIIPIIELEALNQEEVLDDSASTADTEILSTSSQERKTQWPKEFEIPFFTVDVEYRLRQGNLAYLKDSTYLKLTKELKHDILEKLAETMFSFKAYPTNDDYAQVAAALVNKHPCLLESGSSTGWGGWKNSLKFKMGNFRSKMRNLGYPDVTINGGRRGMNNPEGIPSRKRIKKPKKCEINFLPNFPEGHNNDSLELVRKEIQYEMKMRTPSPSLLAQQMDLTFALRRKEIVESAPAISDVLERWPALFREPQVCMEFNRITGKNLKQEFYENLDRHSSRFMDLFKTRRGTPGQHLLNFLQQIKSDQPTEVRTLVLRGLPIMLGDEDSCFFKSSLVSDHRNTILDVPVGILFEDTDLQPPNSLHLTSSIGIILEGQVVMDKMQDLPQAICLLFGLIYALDLNYPKSLANTFDFIQRVLMSMGQNALKPRVQSLANQLFA
ncbi:uncharacterized protein LOC109062712 isoform X2 [Cyprinus carpio]|nr:uncharacterized protein LOC109062712 isoform X2 [Cyprinus carpio]XP_042599714.1 uncharacterized protein LOC109062712 isoform X2 [Cyprinus carpio]